MVALSSAFVVRRWLSRENKQCAKKPEKTSNPNLDTLFFTALLAYWAKGWRGSPLVSPRGGVTVHCRDVRKLQQLHLVSSLRLRWADTMMQQHGAPNASAARC